MAEPDRRHHLSRAEDRNSPVRYSSSGHPSVEQLTAEQGTGPISDVAVLHGDFWPEEESVEQFLEALYEWRGHKRSDSVR